ncbi:MAG: helix-turn-helix transcriptional regulator [Saprospiraceae bacterium]|nr:helix-turn-helix transcriptional regulator [Saprospiraceae bacterium]
MITASEYLKKEIGKEGSPDREKFRQESYAYYLSEILKSRRKQLKWSQEELAIKVGKKRTYISRVENGEDLRISNFIQIASVLGLNFELKSIV